MNYEKIYNAICIRGKNERDIQYSEQHHILPKCMGGDDTNSNLTKLSAREHYIVHWLLIKINPDNKKIAYAFNSMCRRSDNQQRCISSLAYEAARRHWVKHHPMRDPNIKAKMVQSHRRRGERVRETKADNRNRCICGSKIYSDYSKFCSMKCYHSNRDKKYITREYREKLSHSRKKYLSSLTEEEDRERLYKTIHSNKVDHAARGRAVSLSKKGKKTNQQHIMGERFAGMSDAEFDDYLSTVSWKVHKKFISLRDKWKNKK